MTGRAYLCIKRFSSILKEYGTEKNDTQGFKYTEGSLGFLPLYKKPIIEVTIQCLDKHIYIYIYIYIYL